MSIKNKIKSPEFINQVSCPRSMFFNCQLKLPSEQPNSFSGLKPTMGGKSQNVFHTVMASTVL